jgi:hypothetical protein
MALNNINMKNTSMINLHGTEEQEIAMVQRAYYTISSHLMNCLRLHKDMMDHNLVGYREERTFRNGTKYHLTVPVSFNAPTVHLQRFEFKKDFYQLNKISCYRDEGLTYVFLMTRAINDKTFYLYPDCNLLLDFKIYTSTVLLNHYFYRIDKKAAGTVKYEATLQADIDAVKDTIKRLFDKHPEERNIIKQADNEYREAICHTKFDDPFAVGNAEMKALTCFNIFVLAEQEEL